MAVLKIEGTHPLCGELSVHGAKNSALPLLAASLLCSQTVTLHDCPSLSDVTASLAILRHLGCAVTRDGATVTVTPPPDGCKTTIPSSLMHQMRSSIVFLGAMLAKGGQAHLCFPGGCELGPRPIDWHLAALRRMGVRIVEQGGVLRCATDGRLHGARIVLSFPSVGATENVLLAAVLAVGTTEIHNAAREPEIIDLCCFLKACGARISGIGGDVLYIEGVSRLHGCEYAVMPDRIVAATYLSAAAITGGDLTVHNAPSPYLTAVLSAFEEAGCTLAVTPTAVRLKAPRRLSRVKSIRTLPYPGFPTDAQAPLMAMLTTAAGTSVFCETMFDSRYKHVAPLTCMGAHIKTEGRVAIVEGVRTLHGARVGCTDLRGGAALVVAALAAEGTTTIEKLCHLDRGYAALETTLESVGAVIRRVDE